MQQRAVVHGDHGHDLQVIVLAGNGGQRGACAQHHALLVGAVHVDHAGGRGIQIVVVGTGVQGVDLRLHVVHVALGAGDALGDGLHGGVIQGLDLALVLLHHGLDLGVGVTGRLISRSVKGLLLHLALVGLVLVVVGLILDTGLTEVVRVVLDALQQLIVLVHLGLVDLELAFQVVLLHVQVGALDVGHEVALVHIAALGDVQLGEGAGIAGHDVGLVAGLHRAGVLADVDAVGAGAPHQQKDHEQAHQNDKGVPVGRYVPVHHNAAVLQIIEILDGRCHSYLVSINTSTTASSSSWLTKMV